MNGFSFFGTHTESYSITHFTSRDYREPGEHLNYHHNLVFNFSHVSIQHTLSGNKFRTETPFILYRAPYILHSCSTLDSREYERYILNVNMHVMTEFGCICDIGRLRNLPGCMIPMDTEGMEHLRPLLEHMKRAYREKESKNVWVALIAVIMNEVKRLLPQDISASPEKLSYIHELMYYIVENPGEDLRLETLAKKFYCNENKLMRDFRAVTHSSIHEYISIVRVARAKNWLMEDVPISVIAGRCGFTHESAFIRLFRTVEGITPGKYRESVREREHLPSLKYIENYRPSRG